MPTPKRWYRVLQKAGKEGLEPIRKEVIPDLDNLTFREPVGLYTGQLENLPKLIDPAYSGFEGREAIRGLGEFVDKSISKQTARIDLHSDTKVLDYSKPDNWFQKIKAFGKTLSEDEKWILEKGSVDVSDKKGHALREGIQKKLTNFLKAEGDAVIFPDIAADQPDISQLVLLNQGKATGTVRDKGKLVKKLLGIGAAGGAAGTFASEDNAEAATSLKNPIPLAKEGMKTLESKWIRSSADKNLRGMPWKDKIIKGVFKPQIKGEPPKELLERFEFVKKRMSPETKTYKDLEVQIETIKKGSGVNSDKRVVLFEDGTYNVLDRDDLHTVSSVIGLKKYAGEFNPESVVSTRLKKAEASKKMRDQFGYAHKDLDEARKDRIRYARNQFDLFGGQEVGVQTVRIGSSYYNLPSYHADTLLQFKAKLENSLKETLAAYNKVLQDPPKKYIDYMRRTINSIHILENEHTVIPSLSKGFRNWENVPEGWENING